MQLNEVSWVFICQAGRLELEAAVLAASLRANLGEHANLIAAIPLPESVMGCVSQEVRDFLDSIQVRQETFVNTLVTDFPAGRSLQTKLMMNKAFALLIDRDAPVVVFLDSDQVCHAPFDLTNLLVPMVGRRVFYPGAAALHGTWERLYELCETQMPQQRSLIRHGNPTVWPIVCPPCFNSGFISVHRPWVYEVATRYIDFYRRISEHDALGMSRYYEEQAALPIAVIKSRVPYELDLQRIDGSLCHYFNLERLAKLPQANTVRHLAATYPALSRLLADSLDWQPVVSRKESLAGGLPG